MTNMTTKASLSQAKRRFIELMQWINHGRIEGLKVHDGDPVLDPPPVIVRDIKLGGENGPRRELGANDFALKSQIVEFFSELDDLGNGTVDMIEIKHGLPFRMSIKETIRA